MSPPRLSARNKRWHVLETPPEFIAAHNGTLPPLIAALLYQRGLRSDAALREFFATDYHLHDPFRMRGMETAITIPMA